MPAFDCNINELSNNIQPSCILTDSTIDTLMDVESTMNTESNMDVEYKTNKINNNKTILGRKRKINDTNIIDNVNRIKTSYFATAPIIQPKGRGNKKNVPYSPPNDNKIVFLVTDRSSYNIYDKNFDSNIFDDDDVDPLLDMLNGPPSPKRTKVNDMNKLPPILPKSSQKPIEKKPIEKNPIEKNIVIIPPKNGPDPIDNFFNLFFGDLFKDMLDDDNPSNSIAPRKVPPNKSNTSIPPVPKPIECKNPLCNHKTLEEDPTPSPLIDISIVKTLGDLIALGRAFHCKKQTTYKGLNLRLMNNLVAPLAELNDMIGMRDVKEHVVDHILFFLQGFNTNIKCGKCQDCVYGLPCVQSNTEMLHTVITGPSGVGKTCLGRIMGNVYKAMGILSNGTFHEVTRTDFVAGYLGQTAIKTQKLIDSCKGGVMFIDEAYSMGSKEKRDSFAKEALDTLNKNLSDNRDLLCIIAGYEKDLEECFFSINDGLKRRFTFRYNVQEYDYKELLDIFKLKVEKEGWSIDFNSEELDGNIKYSDDDLLNLFRSHKDSFPYSGGDIETYFLQCKIAHGRRMPGVRKCLSYNDLENGFKQFTKNRKFKKVKRNDDEEQRPNMYKFD